MLAHLKFYNFCILHASSALGFYALLDATLQAPALERIPESSMTPDS